MRSTDSRTPRRSARETGLRAGLTAVVLGGLVAFMLAAPRAFYTFDWAAVWRDGDYASYMLGGLLVTVAVSLGSLVLALVCGVLGGVARLSRHWFWHQLGTIYVELIRGTPLLVQIVVAYYCFGTALRSLLEGAGAPAGLVRASQDPIVIGILTLGVFAGAYVAEIVRAAILSIDPGQTEAALSQGMTRRQAFRWILFPQALRRMIPPLTGQFVSLVKDSSLLSVIAVPELMKRASEVHSSSYATFEVYLPLAGLYLLVCFPLSHLARRLELRLAA